MAVTTAAVAVAAGATVAASQVSKKGAQDAAAQFDKVQYNPKSAAKRVNQYMPVAFGGGTAFKDMQEMTNEIVLQQLRGQVSPETQTMIGRQMLGTGATDMGPGAVNQLYTGYLGLTQEDVKSQGIQQYRSLYAQYQQAVDKQASAQYTSDLNRATARAAGIQGEADATASMIQGLGSLVGGYVGGGMGGMLNGGGAGGMFGAGTNAAGGAQPSSAYFTAMAQAGRNPYPQGMTAL
ncbi:hypothetical protein SAMN02745166_01091 [Prosthecobacter debontii]|uniref:Uncharacterized protein n=1 Tax=Prosthecobacter debontii TaxID=48467 RepID=A0A1T4X5V1_9BACT|nr:hypothetical protein [Prosthecobacter debontii]SKA85050.1 hypothetical protein SAMN02745166_01091 [Prosthecobacter debontii]